MDNVVGVVIGRFQVPELHEAHKYLLNTVSEAHSRLVVLLGVNSIPGTRDYPLDYQTRVQMIQADYQHAVFYPLPNMANDYDWSKNVDDVLHRLYPMSSFKLYGGPDCFAPHYEGRYEVVRIETISGHTGTSIRHDVGQRPIASRNFRAGAIYHSQNRFPSVHTVVDIAVIRVIPHKVNVRTVEVLMGRKIREAFDDGYRFIGGFVDDADRSLEAACARELKEETGIDTSRWPVDDRSAKEILQPTPPTVIAAWQSDKSLDIDPRWQPVGATPFRFAGSVKINDWRYKGTNDGIMTSFFVTTLRDGTPAPKASDDMDELVWVDMNALLQSTLPVHKPLAKLLLSYVAKELPDVTIVHQS